MKYEIILEINGQDVKAEVDFNFEYSPMIFEQGIKISNEFFDIEITSLFLKIDEKWLCMNGLDLLYKKEIEELLIEFLREDKEL